MPKPPTTRRTLLTGGLNLSALAALTASTVLAAGIAGTAQAQGSAYPSKPITLIVPYSAGTTADTLARLLGA